MRSEQVDDRALSSSITKGDIDSPPESSNNTWEMLSAESSRDALRKVFLSTIDAHSSISNADAPRKDSSLAKRLDTDRNDDRVGENADQSESFEFVGLKLRTRSPEDQLKHSAEKLIPDSAEKEKFLQDMKKLMDRAKDDELKKEQLDTVFSQLANLMDGRRNDLSKSAIPENLRVAMTKQLLSGFANPDKLSRENSETKEAYEYRKLDYRFKPDVVLKRIAEDLLGKVTRKPDA